MPDRITIRAAGVAAAALLAAARPATAADDEPVVMDEVSVTATRVARPTSEVPESISVIGAERIEKENMFNIQDAIEGTPGVQIQSKNGAYDSRLIIRGAGQKANYGVREIMVMRDGVPVTDPDSFTHFDFIDTQDIERIEITRGPGSIHGAGSAGGTIQIISKSVFDLQDETIKIGGGTSEITNLHTRVGTMVGDSNAFVVTASRRTAENDWRRWNDYEQNQISLKHGYMFADGATIETELSYHGANLQLPGTMSVAQFNTFKETGKQSDNDDAFKHSGRYSDTWFFNSKYEKQWDQWSLKPRVYAQHWKHFHPVTGAVNSSPHNWVYGLDIEADYRHQLLQGATLVTGITGRQDRRVSSKKYKYRDIVTGGGGAITRTLSDRKGDLIEEEDSVNTIVGLYAQETVDLTGNLTLDLGLRYDRSEFNLDINEIQKYQYSWPQTYVAGEGFMEIDKGFDLWSPKVGVTYALTDRINAYGLIAQSDQVPSQSEIETNHDLSQSTARNYEIGFKGRARHWAFDASFYYTSVTDEIVSVLESGETTFANAGEVDKKGVELSGEYELLDGVRLGGSYAYSKYIYDKFEEKVGNSNVSRAGNHVPYVPLHQYSLFASYDNGDGLTGRVQADTWGSYWLDNANTEKYGGYDLVTEVMIGYRHGAHELSFQVENLFDKKYAAEVKKDTRGTKSHSAAPPRTFLVSYDYRF